MTEQGVVTRLDSSQVAEVGCPQNAACAKCGVCRPGAEGGMMIVEAQNLIGAQVNDIVQFELPAGQFIRDSLMVFITPLVALFTGYVVGVRLIGSEVAGIIGGLIFLGLAIFVLRWYDDNIVRRAQMRATITRIIK